MNPATAHAKDERTLRADARRNRERIVAAARARFAADGLDAQMDEIAHEAKVGVGTLYRHFPTKDDLIAALAADRFARLAELAREAIAAQDPWPAFCDFMRNAAALHAHDLALSEAAASRPGMMSAAAEKAGMSELLEELVSRAKGDGMREDVEWRDVPMMICGLGRIAEADGHQAPFMSWERLLALLLDGLRAPGETPLPGR